MEVAIKYKSILKCRIQRCLVSPLFIPSYKFEKKLVVGNFIELNFI